MSQLMEFLALSRAKPLSLVPFSEPLLGGGELQVWDTGVVCVEPPTPGPLDVVLSCGIHGNETAPIELCERLLQAIVSGELVCRVRLLLIFGNLPAINLGVRHVTENLNRLFSGAHRQGEGDNQERRRAALLEQYVTRFYGSSEQAERVHYDLHTAIRASHHEKFAIYPYVPNLRYARHQFAFLQHSAINTVLLAQAPANTFSCYSAHHHGAHALTIELGRVRPFGHNDASRVAELEHNLWRLLDSPSWQPPNDIAQLQIFKVAQEITKKSEQFCFHFADDVANFTSFTPNTLLATDGKHQWWVGATAEAVVFPNAGVALGHRAALMVVRTALDSESLN